MMLTAIHNHFNARKLCDVDLSPDVIDRLHSPPPLENAFKAEDHIVVVRTAHGEMKLFKIVVNGVPLIATPTPQVAMANAA